MNFLKPGLCIPFNLWVLSVCHHVWYMIGLDTLVNEREISLKGSNTDLRIRRPELCSPLSLYLLFCSASQPLFLGLNFLFLINFNEEVDLVKVAHCPLYINIIQRVPCLRKLGEYLVTVDKWVFCTLGAHRSFRVPRPLWQSKTCVECAVSQTYLMNHGTVCVGVCMSRETAILKN